MKPFLILDCYIDEPTCLGVPPFISPYPRYIYGALVHGGVKPERIKYLTIDHLRERDYTLKEAFEHIFLIGGAVVPGKYLGAKIGTLAETAKIIERAGNTPLTVGGLINRPLKKKFPRVNVVFKDIEKFANSLVQGKSGDGTRSLDETARWAAAGAQVIKQHPWFPNIICEVETGRGCPRRTHCSFCSEGLAGATDFRSPGDIVREVDLLCEEGCRRFRLGRQADILQYGSTLETYRGDFPKPEPLAVKELFGELKTRRERGSISLVNIDNGNPGSIIAWPEETSQILETMAESITEGDTLPFGIESFDENVVRENKLKILPQDAMKALEIVNKAGGGRRNGIPILLPGINLIHGLKGEDSNTFQKNFNHLENILERGLLIKRINIRKLQPYPGTDISLSPPAMKGKVSKRFEFYRDRIRKEIEGAMLKKIYPLGTVLRNIFILESQNGYSMGKQIASYSITVKIPGEFETHKFKDVLITGHAERSLRGIALPFDINGAGQKELEYIPGISRDRASDIVLAKPFQSVQDTESFFTNTPRELKEVLLNNMFV